MVERFFQKAEIEKKVEEKDGKKVFVMGGSAVLYNKVSDGDFRSILFEPGSMAEALKRDDLEAYSLFNHDPNWVLGTTTNGSLELEEKKDRLRQATYMTQGDNSQIDTMISHVENNRITRMSFGVDLYEEGYSWDKRDGKDIMTVQQVERIRDVSPVTYAAFSDSRLDNAFGKAAREALTCAFKVQYDGPISRTELETLKEFSRSINLLTEKLSKSLEAGAESSVPYAELKERFSKLFA